MISKNFRAGVKEMLEDSIYFKTVNEKFPGIAEKIKLFWGHREFVLYMRELQQVPEGRDRAGFPADVLFALHEMESSHHLIWPQYARKNKNAWHVEGF
jgi:hypothetical protein